MTEIMEEMEALAQASAGAVLYDELKVSWLEREGRRMKRTESAQITSTENEKKKNLINAFNFGGPPFCVSLMKFPFYKLLYPKTLKNIRWSL